LVELCPFSERACGLRMQVLERLGNTGEALLAYETLRRRLADELGAGPGPVLQAHHRRLLEVTAP
jgi:DNA-binding SARP family transcriptional activator